MKQGLFSNEHITRILRETDLDDVFVVAKRHGVSNAVIVPWKHRC
jgi:hypothetical protein